MRTACNAIRSRLCFFVEESLLAAFRTLWKFGRRFAGTPGELFYHHLFPSPQLLVNGSVELRPGFHLYPEGHPRKVGTSCVSPKATQLCCIVVGIRSISRARFMDIAAAESLTQRFLRIVKEIWRCQMDDNCLDLAAQMSFYFSLSIFPFLLVLAALVGWLPSTTLWHNLAQWIANYLPPQSRKLVFATILDLTHGSGGFLSFGIVATLWTASSGFVCLMESLTAAYGFRERRGFLRKRIIALFATVIGGVFVAASFAVLTFGHWAAVLILVNFKSFLYFPAPWEFARWLATLLLMLLALSLVYNFLPDVKRPWHWITPGSMFVAVAVVGASAGFDFYLRYFGNYSKVYGAMAGFIILMAWIYMTSLILLIGAETDSVMEKLKRSEAVV
ncbi:MAG: YihY/virulence factor BrkB family protein [Candidatus Acidiferrales bacterium]